MSFHVILYRRCDIQYVLTELPGPQRGQSAREARNRFGGLAMRQARRLPRSRAAASTLDLQAT